MTKLTVKELEGLSRDDVGTRLTDEHSLYGVVKSKGSDVAVLFRWRYRINGKVCDYTCGTWPTKSLARIRDAQKEAQQALRIGKDPNEAKKIERLAEKAAQAEAIAQATARIAQAEALQTRITVAELFETWVTVDVVSRKDHGQEIRRMFEKDVLPKIGGIAVDDIRKGHIMAVTDALLTRGVPRMAKMILSLMRQMFRFAVDRDIIENDPTSAIRKAKIGGKDTERDRVLSEEEIRALYRQIPSAKLIPATEAAIWIALSTCCRIGEVLKAQWKHVDLDKGEWLIPVPNSKNGKAHTVYLSNFAARQFEALRTISAIGAWCFPNRSGTNHVCVKTVTKQTGDRQRGDSAPMSHRSPHTATLLLSGGDWSPHDLRRTGATMMTALGVLPEVAERCLNHAEEGRLKRIYQRHSYDREKRDAWRLLGERVELLIRDSANVVTLKHRVAVAA
jgi:integrase